MNNLIFIFALMPSFGFAENLVVSQGQQNPQVNFEIMNHLANQQQISTTQALQSLGNMLPSTSTPKSSVIEENLIKLSMVMKSLEEARTSSVKSGSANAAVATSQIAALKEIAKVVQQMTSSLKSNDKAVTALLATQLLSMVNSAMGMASQLTPAQRVEFAGIAQGLLSSAATLVPQVDSSLQGQLSTTIKGLGAVLGTMQALSITSMTLTNMYNTLRSMPNANNAAVTNLQNQVNAINTATTTQVNAAQVAMQNSLLILSNGVAQQLQSSGSGMQMVVQASGALNAIFQAAATQSNIIKNINVIPH